VVSEKEQASRLARRGRHWHGCRRSPRGPRLETRDPDTQTTHQTYPTPCRHYAKKPETIIGQLISVDRLGIWIRCHMHGAVYTEERINFNGPIDDAKKVCMVEMVVGEQFGRIQPRAKPRISRSASCCQGWGRQLAFPVSQVDQSYATISLLLSLC